MWILLCGIWWKVFWEFNFEIIDSSEWKLLTRWQQYLPFVYKDIFIIWWGRCLFLTFLYTHFVMGILAIQVHQVCFNYTNCVVNIVKNGIANHWATVILRTLVRTGPHPIVPLNLLEINPKMPLFRLLLIGGFDFSTITCFIPANIRVLNFELSFCEGTFLSAWKKLNSCTDTARVLVAFSLSLL